MDTDVQSINANQGPPADGVVRVLHVYKTWSPDSFGGIERSITSLCAPHGENGIRTRVAYLGYTKKPTLTHHNGISAIRFPLDMEIASTGFSWSLLLNFKRLSRWADVLHFHFPWPFGDLVYFLSNVGKPVIVTYHSDIVRQRYLKLLYAPLMALFLKRAKAVVATSPNYLATSKVLRQLKTPVHVIPLGIEDASLLPPNEVRQNYWKERIGGDFILFVGVMRYYKGLHLLIEAARYSPCNIVIAGAGPIEGELKKMVKKFALKNVLFVGEVDEADKDALYRLCKFFVFPSHLRSEAFGISLLEAAMYGKAMISSEIGTGTTFINIHEETGLVIEAGNVSALVAAINRLLSNTNDCNRFGINARKRYLALFSAKEMAASYARLYHKIYRMHGVHERPS